MKFNLAVATLLVTGSHAVRMLHNVEGVTRTILYHSRYLEEGECASQCVPPQPPSEPEEPEPVYNAVPPTDAPIAPPPTPKPTPFPTRSPTERPTKSPTKAPQKGPTRSPTETPTTSPTEAPTKGPTRAPVTSRPTTVAASQDQCIASMSENLSTLHKCYVLMADQHTDVGEVCVHVNNGAIDTLSIVYELNPGYSFVEVQAWTGTSMTYPGAPSNPKIGNFPATSKCNGMGEGTKCTVTLPLVSQCIDHNSFQMQLYNLLAHATITNGSGTSTAWSQGAEVTPGTGSWAMNSQFSLSCSCPDASTAAPTKSPTKMPIRQTAAPTQMVVNAVEDGPCACGDKLKYMGGSGFVTGGGWIWLEPEAKPTANSQVAWSFGDITEVTKANFGFVAMFNKGVPRGSTNFGFEGAKTFHFHSLTGGANYTYLEVPDDINARWIGKGKIASKVNPSLSDYTGDYGFMVAVKDIGEPGKDDNFRIRIWNNTDNGKLIFDTNKDYTDPFIKVENDASKARFKGTTLGDLTKNGGGNIQIHRKGSTKSMTTRLNGNSCGCKTTGPQGDGKAFVTGGGWIYLEESMWWSDATGKEMPIPHDTKASFGFVAMYKNGGYDGSTEFNFQAGALHFHSDTAGTPLQMLEIPDPMHARWQGTGKVAFADKPMQKDYKTGYSFYVAVQDWGEPGYQDTWRIVIWKTGTDIKIFDSNPAVGYKSAQCTGNAYLDCFDGTQLGYVDDSSLWSTDTNPTMGGGNVQIHWKGTYTPP